MQNERARSVLKYLQRERTAGWVRLLALLVMLVGYTLLSIKLFEDVDFAERIEFLRATFPVLQVIPQFLLYLLVPFTHWKYFRHSFSLFGVVMGVFSAAAYFMREVYKLPHLRDAQRYLFSSMFGLFYPRLDIDGAADRNTIAELHTLMKIGGPGWLVVQPGCVAVTKNGHEPARVKFQGRYFLRRFEKVCSFANLDEQIGHIGEIKTHTHDGIRVVVRNVHYGFKFLQLAEDRNEANPYPFSEDAILDMTFSSAVGEKGANGWQERVGIFVMVGIRSFISGQDIDFLTAPRIPGQAPRLSLRNEVLLNGVRTNLKTIGTELLWIDAGHIDILEVSGPAENVDAQRLEFWSSRWKGKQDATLAEAEGLRQAYEEQGRAEGQAEMLKTITDALVDIPLKGEPADRIRRILLVRTAQILEGLRDAKEKK